jgi:hypothetical protein
MSLGPGLNTGLTGQGPAKRAYNNFPKTLHKNFLENGFHFI